MKSLEEDIQEEEVVEDDSQLSLDFNLSESALVGISKSTKIRVEAVDILNSALFSAGIPSGGERKAHQKKLLHIFTDNDITITHTGFELSVTDDEEVWLNILYYAKKQQAHETNFAIKVRTSEFLRTMGWPRDGHSYRRLADCLPRLDAGSLEVMNEKGDRYSFSFIRRYALGGESSDGFLFIQLEPEVYRFYQRTNTKNLDHSIRQNLRSPFLKKIYSLLSGKVNAKSVDDFYMLMGVSYKYKRQFKAKLVKALEKMVELSVILTFEVNKKNEVFLTYPTKAVKN